MELFHIPGGTLEPHKAKNPVPCNRVCSSFQSKPLTSPTSGFDKLRKGTKTKSLLGKVTMNSHTPTQGLQHELNDNI